MNTLQLLYYVAMLTCNPADPAECKLIIDVKPSTFEACYGYIEGARDAAYIGMVAGARMDLKYKCQIEPVIKQLMKAAHDAGYPIERYAMVTLAHKKPGRKS